jgi:hypothetical protein
MLYQSKKQLTFDSLETDFKANVIDYAKEQMVIELARKMLKDGMIQFEIVDPRQPIDSQSYSNPGVMEWEVERRRFLMENRSVELSLKINV